MGLLSLALWIVPGTLFPGERPAASTQAAGPEDPVHDEYLKINYVFNRELYEIAIPRYKKLLADHPRFKERAMVHYALALCHSRLASRAAGEQAVASRLEHHRKAAEALRAALEERNFPHAVEARELLASSLLELGDPSGAAEAYRWVLDHAQGGARESAAVGLADCQYSRAAYAEAEAAYRRALEILGTESGTPLRARARFQLAMSIYQQGPSKFEEASRLFTELAATGGANAADSLYMAALANHRAGRLDAALGQYEELASEAPEGELREAALFGQGSALFELERFAEAEARLAGFLERHPRSRHAAAASLHRARALLEMRKSRTAAEILANLIEDREVGEEAALWLARAYSSRGNHDASVKILRGALEAHREGRNRQALQIELATELLAGGAVADARKVLDGLDAGATAADHAAYLETYALHRSAEYEASLEACSAFLARHPESRFARDVRRLEAENRFLLGRYPEAAAAYEDLLAGDGSALPARDRLLARFRIGEALFFAKEYARAAAALDRLSGGELGKELEEVAAKDPAFASYHYLLGEALYQEREYARARDAFRKYLAGGDRDLAREYAAEARFKLAHSSHLAGEIDAARAAYIEALERDPKSPHRGQTLFELAQIAFAKEDFDTAHDAFRRVVDEEPESEFAPYAMRFLGWIAQQAGTHDRATSWYRRLAEEHSRHPVHPEALYLLSLSLTAQGDLEGSRRALERLRSEHPGDEHLDRARIQEAVTYARENRLENALAILEELESRELPADVASEARLEMARCLRKLERPADAARKYRDVLSVAKDAALTSVAALELAELELGRGEFESAKRLLEPLASGGGELRRDALYQLSWCHYRLGDVKALDETFQKLVVEYPSSEYVVQGALLTARLHLEREDPGGALDLFKLILDIRPEPAEAEQALVSYAECLNDTRRFDEAVAALARFETKYPRSRHRTQARFALGWAHENLGRFEDAEARYREAAKDATPTAARAQFQLGQSKASRKLYADAIVEFLQVPARYSYPEWSSRALLQVAGCFAALEDFEKARAYYAEVAEKYKETDEGRLARERLQGLPR